MPWFRTLYDGDPAPGYGWAYDAEAARRYWPDEEYDEVTEVPESEVPASAVIEDLQQRAESENYHGMMSVYDEIENDMVVAGIDTALRRAFWFRVHGHGGYSA